VKALRRLLVAEFHGRRLRAMALLFVVVVFSSAALIAGLQTQSRAGQLWDDAFAKANGAHVTVYSSDDAVLHQVASDPRVVEHSAIYRQVDDVEIVANKRRASALVREMGPNDIPPVARPRLRSGRWVRAGAADEIVIERSYALNDHVSVGDSVVLRQSGVDVPFRVVGEAVDLIDCFYPQCDPTPTWVDPAGFARLDTTHASGAVFLRINDPHHVDSFTSGILDRYGNKAGTNDWLNTRGDATVISGFFGAFLAGFGVFVMIASVLVILGAMASRVIARRRDIGLLKAVGVTPGQIAAAIVLANAVVAAVGVAIGWVFAGLFAGRLQLTEGKVLGTGGGVYSFSRLIIAFVVIELLVAAAILVPALHSGRLPTTTALSPVPTVKAHQSRLAALAERMGLGPISTTGLRDAFARPGRSAFTVAAIAVAIVAVVVSFGFDRTVHRAFSEPSYTGHPYDATVVPTSPSAAPAVVDALNHDPNVAHWFTTTERHAVIGQDQYLVRALGGDIANAGYRVQEGRLPTAPDEAIAGYGLLQALGKSVGDTVDLTIGSKPAHFRLVGWYSETEDSGKVLMFPLAGLASVEPNPQPEAWRVHVRDGVKVDDAVSSLQQTLRGQAQVVPNVQTSNPQITAFRTSFQLVTILVLLLAFANLATTMILAVRERSHDLGVLRSVGFTPRQVFSVIAIGAAVLALVGAVIGVPVGWLGFRVLIETVGRQAGIGPQIGVNPTWWALLLCVPAAVGAGLVLGLAVGSRAATAEVADLVRYE
jgi:putative ABC transport system permease protein